MLLLSLACMLAAAATLLAIFYYFFSAQVRSDIQSETEAMARNLAYVQDDLDYLRSLNLSGQMGRVTLVAEDGRVLFDSFQDILALPNHLGRPEIAEALDRGAGISRRWSETVGEETYYYALRMDNGNVLRIARTVDGIRDVFFHILPMALAAVLITVAVCRFLASGLTRSVVEPIRQVASGKYSGDGTETYDELTPLIQQISHQQKQIEHQMRTLQDRTATIETITKDMKEGLILLDPGCLILSANQSALDLFGASEPSYTDRHILELTRNRGILQNIRAALNGTSGETTLEFGAKTVQIFFDPVYYNKDIHGAIILFLDITEKISAEKSRRQFSANVSHELKTPLTVISGLSEMMVNGMVKSEDTAPFIQKIHSEAKRLIALIEDIIQLSQWDEITSESEKHMDTFDLRQLTVSVAGGLKPLMDEKEIRLEISGESFDIRGNQVMIAELLQNLLDNGVKYNRRGGRLTVQLSKEAGFVTILVSDTGIGIPREHISHIFERFYRVDPSRSKKTGGTGLGLSIVKHIAQYHRGCVDVESEEGVGSAMTVRLPADQNGS
jgi:two-component system phosphate regulon sensor histidine kinase PhoR